MHTGPTKRTAVLTKQIKGSKPKRDEGPVLAEQAKPTKKAKTTVTEPDTSTADSRDAEMKSLQKQLINAQLQQLMELQAKAARQKRGGK